MADEPTATIEAPAPAAEPSEHETDDLTERPGGGGEEVSLEEARRLRSESKNLRQRLRAAEGERDRLKAEGLSDAERRDREHQETRAENERLAATVRRLRVELAARELGVVDPEAAAALLDLDSVDDADDPRALKRALRELVKEKPYLAPQGGNGFDGGPGRGGAARATDMNQLIRAAAGRA